MKEDNEILVIPKKVKIKYTLNALKRKSISGKVGILSYTKPDKRTINSNSLPGKLDGEFEIDNLPTEGFKVDTGGVDFHRTQYSYYRLDLVTIVDPRGFDFTITSVNFLNILKYCDCTNETLCGQFVYSWDRFDGFKLLPCASEEYQESMKVMNSRLEKIYTANDLIPGTKYIFKIGKLPYSFEPEDGSDSGIFIGYVKFPKDFSKKFTTGCLFYCKKSALLNTNDNRQEFVYVMDPKNIDFEKQRGCLSESEVDDILRRFNSTAFSWEFWNNPSGVIDKIEIIDNKDKYGFSLSNSDSNKVIIFTDGTCKDNEFYYNKKYIYYVKDSRFGSGGKIYYTKRYQNYLAYKFKVTPNGKLEIENKIVDLGKCSKTYDSLHYYSTYNNVSITDIYPKASQNDIALVINTKQPLKGTSGYIRYKTIYGEYSSSLQEILSLVSHSSMEDFPALLKTSSSYKMYLPVNL